MFLLFASENSNRLHTELSLNYLKDTKCYLESKAVLLHLKTFALIVSAHPYCARKSTRPVIHERALSNKMNNDRADGYCYSFDWI